MSAVQTTHETHNSAKTESSDSSSSSANSGLPFEEVAAHPEPVDLNSLLNEISDSVLRHIVCDRENAYAAALWIAVTYLVHLFDVIALLVITAPEMRCGKSEFKRLIGKMVLRPIGADNMSAAVLFRCFDLWSPTLLVDEYDTFVKNNDELRGVFNSGHQRGGCVWRCVGDDFVPKAFNVFGPKVLAGIGNLPPTMVDRGIILQLRRKLPSEAVVRQRDVPSEFFWDIQSKLARMAMDYSQAISVARPVLPDNLSDRARDNWEPLFQIAHVAGGDWLEKARCAALKLCGKEEGNQTVGVELLSDIQEAFACKKTDRLSSSDLVTVLCDDPEKRWATYNRGFPITPTQIAKRLGEYGIRSNTIRVHHTTAKGYFLKQFEDAFTRYVFAEQDGKTSNVTPEPSNLFGSFSVTPTLPVTPQDVTRNGDVTCKVPSNGTCDGVTPESEGDYEIDMDLTRHQSYVLDEVKGLIVQERMNCVAGDQEWSKGLPFDYLADKVKDRLTGLDKKLRRTIAGHVLKQLVQRGDLVQRDDHLDLVQLR